MPCPPRWSVLVALLSFTMLAQAQDPPKPPGKVEEVAKPQQPGNPPEVDVPPLPKLEFKEVIKPLPPVAIPDDPPPHEGAFFDLPITIEPPDIIIVEVLEAAPGRPITGERLVRPDGTVSLGFYGDLYVRGLTPEQVKVKTILQLRKFLNDEVLGLVRGSGPIEVEIMPEVEKPPAPATIDPPVPKPKPEAKPAEKKEGRPTAGRSRERRPIRIFRRRHATLAAQTPSPFELADPGQDGKPKAADEHGSKVRVIEPGQVDGNWTIVPPAESDRVFVDVVAHNTHVYYVQGDVGVPGRLPFTGKETVLDALNYAGGFLPTAEPTDIHLYRPARGGKPAKDYKIDLDAIHKGIATANLQVFPNDRLIVGRNAIVKKTVEIDRAVSPINSVLNSLFQYSVSARMLAAINTPPSGGSGGVQMKVNGQNVPIPLADPTPMTPAQRDAFLKDWAEFLWSISSKEGGALLDEKAFKESLMKKLTPAPESK